MNLKTYTLSVSLAAIIGLLVSIVPFFRSVLEYRSPESVDPRAELSSVEAFAISKGKDGIPNTDRAERAAYLAGQPSRSEWQAMYDNAKEQHIQSVRSQAGRSRIAYGALCSLCLVLLITHLWWARRFAA